MPRRIRTESGYTTGRLEYNASRDLPSNYGPGPAGKQMEGGKDGVATYSDGRRTASVSAHGSWWDNTGRSRDASHGTQVSARSKCVEDANDCFAFIYFYLIEITKVLLECIFPWLCKRIHDWTRATSKPSPISNGRTLVCEKMSEDIRPSTVTTDPRRTVVLLAVVYLLPLVTMLHTKMKEVDLAMVIVVGDIDMMVEAGESRPTMDRLLTMMASSPSKAGEDINTFVFVYDTISKLNA